MKFFKCSLGALFFALYVGCAGVSSTGTSPADPAEINGNGGVLDPPNQVEPVVGTTISKPLPKMFSIPSLFGKLYFKFVYAGENLLDARTWFENFNPTRLIDMTFYRSLIFQGQVSASIDTVGEIVLEVLNSNLANIKDDELLTVVLNKPVNFLRVNFNLDVQIVRVADDILRFYFLNHDTQEILGTYLLQFNDNGEFIKGLFAFVSPTALENPSLKLGRAVMYVFDFSNPDVSYSVAKADMYDYLGGLYYSKKVRSACYESVAECRGDYAEINSPAPARMINTNRTAHFSYSNNADACLNDVSYTNAGVVLKRSYLVDENGLTQNSCPYLAPVWATSLPDTAEFLMRVEDTNPEGGDAKAWYGDGKSKEGWDSLMLKTIEEWMR